MDSKYTVWLDAFWTKSIISCGSWDKTPTEWGNYWQEKSIKLFSRNGFQVKNHPQFLILYLFIYLLGSSSMESKNSPKVCWVSYWLCRRTVILPIQYQFQEPWTARHVDQHLPGSPGSRLAVSIAKTGKSRPNLQAVVWDGQQLSVDWRDSFPHNYCWRPEILGESVCGEGWRCHHTFLPKVR